MDALQYALSRGVDSTMRHAPWSAALRRDENPRLHRGAPEHGKASPSKKRPPRGRAFCVARRLKSPTPNGPVLQDACRAKKLEFTKKTTRFQLAQLLHPELPDFCENHEHKRRRSKKFLVAIADSYRKCSVFWSREWSLYHGTKALLAPTAWRHLA